MLNENNYLFENFDFNTSIQEKSIEKIEEILKIKFPSDYVDFMLKTNGGEGPLGKENYLRLWKIEELPKHNEGYLVNENAPGLVIIGTDGGGTAYGYDFRKKEPKIVEIDFIGMDIEEPHYSTYDFLEFIKYLYNYLA
jgi:hypothetical protein